MRWLVLLPSVLLAGCMTPTGGERTLQQNAIDAAVEADRAFARDAERLGQWTAFRSTATQDAWMFLPQPTRAHEFLRGREDPSVSVQWWPTRAVVSCDGMAVANVGGASWPSGGATRYLTWWVRESDGQWRWTMDTGETVASPPRRTDAVERSFASCDNLDAMPPLEPTPHSGSSPDTTLRWWHFPAANGRPARVRVDSWDGSAFRMMVETGVE